MHVEYLALRNFRCFGPDRTVIELAADLTAFIGGNGSGKTAACVALQRLFGVSSAERAIQLSDFHVPPNETGDVTARDLTIEAVFAFPELNSDEPGDNDSVPEFFHRMASDDNGTLKCRIVLEATWQADGTLDGSIEARCWVIQTLAEQYTDEDKVELRGAERARIQVVYVPATRNGARQVTAFLRGRLWRAAQWSPSLRTLVEKAATQLGTEFHSEPAIQIIEAALKSRWSQLHGAGTHATPSFEPLRPEVTELLREAELRFQPDHSGQGRPADMLSDGQRSLLHLALTTTSIDVEAQLSSGAHIDGFDLAAARLPVLTLLVVEEPENSLSPFYLSRIVTQMLEVTTGTRAQGLLATHSPSTLNRITPSSIRYFRLEPSTGTASARRITLPDSATDDGKYVREAVQSHPEIYFARFVVLGEGDTEVLVIPRIAQARGVNLDPSFVAMVPLGGRHTNHFWRLLNDLHIPHATLLDLDYGRAGAGPARLRDAFTRLATVGVNALENLDGFNSIDDLTDDMTTEQMTTVMNHLRTFGVFFSSPLDLDMLLLRAFPDAYKTLQPGERGPQASEATDAVLGSDIPDPARGYWKPDDPETAATRQENLRWYRYLFLTRSKPSTHLRALTRLTDTDLADDAPNVLTALIDHIKHALPS